MQDATDFSTSLQRLATGQIQPLTCPTEAQWHDAWMAENISEHTPLTTAMLGGAFADRLAWVFLAGYQGMMRYAFPFCPAHGWASYLVAEDKTGEYPGARLTTSEGAANLSGFKSWVAAAEHVDHLVVRMTKPDSEVLVLVEADEAGVKLSSRESPGFLADLSQGFAAFENVSISNEQTFSDAQLPENFQYSEPYHVLTALNAFMISQTLKHGGDPNITTEAADSLRMVGDLLELGGDEFFLGVADLDARTTETARRFEEFLDGMDEALLLRWRKDRGVVNMFSRGLQKRAKWLRDD